MNKADLKFMRRALELAEKEGRYASPNPKVGAVLVKGDRVIGEGGHRRYGGPHAEVVALRKAGAKAKGATLYVTLEPCCHYGKTPPCVEAIVRAGVRRVVAAMKDPFPQVRGKGFALLRWVGTQVEVGLLEKEAAALNETFLLSIQRSRPKVILKAAASLDGKIATVAGRSKWITGEKARRKTHELRAKADAILVGGRTALLDNPSLTVRLPAWKRSDGWPLRVVLDSELRSDPKWKLFQSGAKTVVFTSTKASPSKQKRLEQKGASVFRVPSRGKVLSLKAVLQTLHSLNVRVLLVEGGGEVHASFLEEKLADEAVLFLSPKILGGPAPTWVGGKGVENPARAPYLKNIQIEPVGEDLLLTGRF